MLGEVGLVDPRIAAPARSEPIGVLQRARLPAMLGRELNDERASRIRSHCV